MRCIVDRALWRKVGFRKSKCNCRWCAEGVANGGGLETRRKREATWKTAQVAKTLKRVREAFLANKIGCVRNNENYRMERNARRKGIFSRFIFIINFGNFDFLYREESLLIFRRIDHFYFDEIFRFFESYQGKRKVIVIVKVIFAQLSYHKEIRFIWKI